MLDTSNTYVRGEENLHGWRPQVNGYFIQSVHTRCILEWVFFHRLCLDFFRDSDLCSQIKLKDAKTSPFMTRAIQYTGGPRIVRSYGTGKNRTMRNRTVRGQFM